LPQRRTTAQAGRNARATRSAGPFAAITRASRPTPPLGTTRRVSRLYEPDARLRVRRRRRYIDRCPCVRPAGGPSGARALLGGNQWPRLGDVADKQPARPASRTARRDWCSGASANASIGTLFRASAPSMRGCCRVKRRGDRRRRGRQEFALLPVDIRLGVDRGPRRATSNRAARISDVYRRAIASSPAGPARNDRGHSFESTSRSAAVGGDTAMARSDADASVPEAASPSRRAASSPTRQLPEAARR
jgi:hypothetical protein